MVQESKRSVSCFLTHSVDLSRIRSSSSPMRVFLFTTLPLTNASVACRFHKIDLHEFDWLNHGLYCCISHWPMQWEWAIFDPPQHVMKLETYNYRSGTTHHAKRYFDPTTCVVSTNSQFATVRFFLWLPFFVSSLRPQVAQVLCRNLTKLHVLDAKKSRS